VNTYHIRIIGYQRPQVETFRYWFLSHFPHLSSVEVVYLTAGTPITPLYRGLTLILLFNEPDVRNAHLLLKGYSEHPIIIYHDSIKHSLDLLQGETYPLHECMMHLEKKFHSGYEREKEKDVSFTKREKEVLELFAQGMSVKEVAYNLQISRYTVATHQRSLYLKTKSHSLQQLTLFASMEYKRVKG